MRPQWRHLHRQQQAHRSYLHQHVLHERQEQQPHVQYSRYRTTSYGVALKGCGSVMAAYMSWCLKSENRKYKMRFCELLYLAGPIMLTQPCRFMRLGSDTWLI